MNIIEAIQDPKLFAPWFRGSSWDAWLVFLKALFAFPMEKAEMETFSKHTGRQTAPSASVREAWLVVGRRGGKSLTAAIVAVFLATFRDYSKVLMPGERGTVMLIAADRRQARVLMRYISGFIDNIPMLRAMVVHRTRESIELSNRIILEVHSCNFRSVRGYSIVAAVCDEISFWHSDESAANPDVEVLNGIRPGLVTIPGSLLLCISSPYARRGALWDAYNRHYGKDESNTLVWRGTTREMNPLVPQDIIDEALERDEPAAKAEYLAEFRTDVETFISRESLSAAVVPHRVELPYTSQFQYFAFVDPSGGQADSMTLAVAHREGNGRAVLDMTREAKPPFSPDTVAANFALEMRRYGINSCMGDRYAGEWPRERFRVHRIEYQPSTLTKSEIYKAWLPDLNSGKVELLDNSRLFNQILNLERRTGSGGREQIDHAPGGHDDLANSAAGALLMCTGFGGPRGGPSRLTGL